jgi:hypothetical protein
LKFITLPFILLHQGRGIRGKTPINIGEYSLNPSPLAGKGQGEGDFIKLPLPYILISSISSIIALKRYGMITS